LSDALTITRSRATKKSWPPLSNDGPNTQRFRQNLSKALRILNRKDRVFGFCGSRRITSRVLYQFRRAVFEFPEFQPSHRDIEKRVLLLQVPCGFTRQPLCMLHLLFKVPRSRFDLGIAAVTSSLCPFQDPPQTGL